MADRIICYGDVIDDIVVTPQDPIQPDTDTRSEIRVRPGGSAANTAAWLAIVGSPVDFVGVVGRGDAQRHAEALSGVDAFLVEHPELPTGRIVIIVQGNRRDMLTDRGANVKLAPAHISDEQLSRVRLLHLTGHTLLNDAGCDGTRELIDRCRTANVLVSVSPGSARFVSELGPERVRNAFDGANLIFAGYDDGRILTGESSPEAIARALGRQFGTGIVTLGPSGYLACSGSIFVAESVVARPAVDPTGAGDAFCAGFLHRWLMDQDIAAAARDGADLAAEAVGIVGGRPR